MSRDDAMRYVQEHGPRMTAALAVITGRTAADDPPLGVIESEAQREGDSGTVGRNPAENGAESAPAPTLAAAPPVPALEALAFRRDVRDTGFPVGTEFGILTDFPAITLARFARAYPGAVALRTFEHYRKGCPLVEVTVPCLHWLDLLGQVRVTTCDEVSAPGRCRVCRGEYKRIGDACPRCHGTKEAPAYLLAGRTFMETQRLDDYWLLLSVGAPS